MKNRAWNGARCKNRLCPSLLSLGLGILGAFRLLRLSSIRVDFPLLIPSTAILQNQTILPSPVQIAPQSRHLFLGIISHPTIDGRLRNVIRKTYLETKYEMNAFPKICPIHQNSWTIDPSCQIVYAFLAEVQPKAKRAPAEDDMIFLARGCNRVHQFFHHLLESNFTQSSFQFDFVAVTHSGVVLYPDRMWPPNLLEGSGVGSDSMIYVDAKDYNASKQFPDYLFLSTKLVKQIMTNSSSFHANLPDADTRQVLDQIITAKKLKTVGLPDDESHQNLDQNVTSTSVTLRQKFEVVDASIDAEADFLLRWDRYKDRFHVQYNDPVEEGRIRTNPRINHTVGTCRHGPRVLMGIFTMQHHEKEIKRRKTIRDTYLSFFQHPHTTRKDRNRICSLLELLSTMDQGNHSLLEDCQLVYVFVAGGNSTGPTERLVSDVSNPMTLRRSSATNETDIVLLNIKENMNEGKSQTFFKFAADIVDEKLYFDYMAKVDSDTLVFPDKLAIFFSTLPRFPNNVRVYGGVPIIKKIGHELVGPAYQQGAFYWMSVDLARFITSEECDREKIFARAEDKDIGNFVHSHSLPIQRYQVSLSSMPFDHPIKSVKGFRNRWEQYLQRIH